MGEATTGGNGVVMTSPDGIHWINRDSNAKSADLRAVAFGNGIYVAVGREGATVSSSDGLQWTLRNGFQNYELYAVTYGNGRFVASGLSRENGEILLLTSVYGTAWTVQGTAEDRDDPETGFRTVESLVFGNGLFVGVGDRIVITSPDGTNWHNHVIEEWLTGVAYADGTFVAVSQEGAILASNNGVKWVRKRSRTKESLRSVAGGNGLWIAVGSSGTVLTSTNAANWSNQLRR